MSYIGVIFVKMHGGRDASKRESGEFSGENRPGARWSFRDLASPSEALSRLSLAALAGQMQRASTAGHRSGMKQRMNRSYREHRLPALEPTP